MCSEFVEYYLNVEEKLIKNPSVLKDYKDQVSNAGERHQIFLKHI